MKTLRVGAKNNAVIQLQLYLNKKLKPHYVLRNDGHFGANTLKAVLHLQKSNGLNPDGIVGPKTWALLIPQTTVTTAIDRPLTPIAPWFDIALAEMGISEIPGVNHNQRIIDYHAATTLKATTDEIPWCSSFVNWVMAQSGLNGTNSALAKSWTDWGIAIEKPIKGDIVVIRRKGKKQDAATGSATGYHVGFYVNASPAVISILGGNQGNQVKKSNFLLRSYEIVAYRRPKIRRLGLPLFINSSISNIA